MESAMELANFPIRKRLWQIACVHGVSKEMLLSNLGQPHKIEPEATFGGEEYWWCFILSSGYLAALTYRVPYEDAVFLTDAEETTNVIQVFNSVVKLGELEVYAERYDS